MKKARAHIKRTMKTIKKPIKMIGGSIWVSPFLLDNVPM
jgi:hypothetical protein